MKADAVLFMAYEYGAAIGRPASETLHYPVDELIGYMAHQKIKQEIIEDHAG